MNVQKSEIKVQEGMKCKSSMIRSDVTEVTSGETQLQCNAGLLLLKNIFIQEDKSILRLMQFSRHGPRKPRGIMA